MDEVLEQQLEHIEKAVAEILDEVKNLHQARITAGEINPGDINQRLRRFLESKK
jgi:hypothetical protein